MKLPKSYSWSNYLTLNRYYVKELEMIKKMVEKVASISENISSHYGSSNSYHLEVTRAFPSLSKTQVREVIRNIELNADKILDLINGGGDVNNGIIEIIKREDEEIIKSIKKTPVMPHDIENTLMSSINDFFIQKITLSEQLRSYLGVEESLGVDLIETREISNKDYRNLISREYCMLEEVIKDKATDEDIFYKILEVLKLFEGVRSFSKTQVNLLRFIKRVRLHDRDFRESFQTSEEKNQARENFVKFVKNFFNNYNQPIITRIEECKNLMEKSDNKFINLSSDNQKKVVNWYKELRDKLFVGTRIADNFKKNDQSQKLKDEKKKFEENFDKFKDLIREVYDYGVSEDDIRKLVLFEDKKNKLKKEEQSN